MFKTTNTIAACGLVAAGLFGLWFIPVMFVSGAIADYLSAKADRADDK